MEEITLNNLPAKYAIIAESWSKYSSICFDELINRLQKSPIENLEIDVEYMTLGQSCLAIRDNSELKSIQTTLQKSFYEAQTNIDLCAYELSLVSYEGTFEKPSLSILTIKYPLPRYTGKWTDPVPTEDELPFIEDIAFHSQAMRAVLKGDLSAKEEERFEKIRADFQTINIPFSTVWYKLDEGFQSGILEYKNKKMLKELLEQKLNFSKHSIKVMIFLSWYELFQFEVALFADKSTYCEECGTKILNTENKIGRPKTFCDEPKCKRKRNTKSQEKHRGKILS